MIVAGLEGAVEVGALGALGAGLYSIGIPKDSIVKYETALKTDQLLLIVMGRLQRWRRRRTSSKPRILPTTRCTQANQSQHSKRGSRNGGGRDRHRGGAFVGLSGAKYS